MTKALKIGKDGKGRKLALVARSDGSFNVLVLCSNYAGHVRGGIATTWRLAGQDQRMTRQDAEALFTKKNKVAA